MATERKARSSKAHRSEKSDLDSTSVHILQELVENPRLSMSELARRVGVSAPTATERVQRLEQIGVIRGYRLDVDPAALGHPVAAYVRVRPGPGQFTQVAELAADLPEVTECHRITGEDCFLVRVQVAKISALESVLDRFLQYGQTISSIVQSSPVPPRALPLPLPENS